MKDFYYTHKKLVTIGGIVLSVILLFTLFIAGTMFNSSRIGVDYNSSAPAGFVEKTMLQTRGMSADSFSVRSVEESGIFPPNPGVPASGVVDSSVERKVIKNAGLDMVVKDTEKTIEKIKSITDENNGFVGSATVWEAGDEKRGNISIRVPSNIFDKALESIKELAVKVTREDINSRDVTEEFVDLEAQLKNYKAAEVQYLKVLNRAYTVEDILKVRKELDRVRGNIERMQGRINYLTRQISMSTISISLTSEAEVKVFGIVWSPWSEVKAGVRDMLVGLIGLVNSLIAFIFKLPLLILWLAIFAAVVWSGWKGAIIIKRRLF